MSVVIAGAVVGSRLDLDCTILDLLWSELSIVAVVMVASWETEGGPGVVVTVDGEACRYFPHFSDTVDLSVPGDRSQWLHRSGS